MKDHSKVDFFFKKAMAVFEWSVSVRTAAAVRTFFCSSGRFGPDRHLQFEPFSNPQSDLAYLTGAAV